MAQVRKDLRTNARRHRDGAAAAFVGQGSPARAQERTEADPIRVPCNEVVLFHREGCAYCERAHAFLDDLRRRSISDR
jgi:hypothetical protein